MAGVDTYMAGDSRFSRTFYSVIRFIVVGVSVCYTRTKVVGKHNIPTTGAFLLAPIHRSNIDTPLAAYVTSRRLRFMGKDSIWKFAPIGWVLSALGAFPVTRGSADREALKRCIAVLEAGEPLVLFPEGTRQSGPIVQPLFDGAAYVAVKAGVPIIPVAIQGVEHGISAPVIITYGPAWQPTSQSGVMTIDPDEMTQLTDTMMIHIARLLPAEYHGYYAGQV